MLQARTLARTSTPTATHNTARIIARTTTQTPRAPRANPTPHLHARTSTHTSQARIEQLQGGAEPSRMLRVKEEQVCASTC